MAMYVAVERDGKWEALQGIIYGIVHNAVDTTKTITVEAGKPMTKVV